jgi:hypothetical protein
MATPLQDPQIRLECLKLATKPNLAPHEAIAAAGDYLAWVAGVPDNSKEPGAGSTTATSAPALPDKPPKSGAAKRQD